MFIRKKLKDTVLRTWMVCFLLLGILGIFSLENVSAAPNASQAASSSQEETNEYLKMGNQGGHTAIGRYQFNYTGNWNYFSNFNAITGMEEEAVRNTAIPGYLNSSGATLSNTSGADGIVKAYLIWETRKPYNQWDENANHVRFIMRDGKTRWSIYPDYVYNDNRKYSGWGDVDQRRCYTMVADVTNIVKAYGYGNYYVANIPEYHTIDAGGDNVCSWQLVVVEESKNFPVRALTLKVGSKWRFGDAAYGDSNYLDTNVQFSNGIKSKSTGNVSGQLLFGCANDHDSMYTNLITTLYTSDSSGNRTRVAGSTLSGGGLYRNGAKQIGEYGIITDLMSVTGGLSNNAPIVGAEVNNIYWNTLVFTGTAIDIAFPDLRASQITKVNSATSVTVTGSINNSSTSANTGIYGGKLVVTIDSALTPTSAQAVINGQTINGTISGNTVTFHGVQNLTSGNTVNYTIECKTENSGKTRFENSDMFSGYLHADGVNTGYWIDKACTSSSYGIPKYKVQLNMGTGIESVTGTGEYIYGSTVTVNADVMTGYHWMQWTGDCSATIQKYSFKMPAHNITMEACAEANTYTIVFDPNDGTAVSPIPDITVKYDEEVILPDILLSDGTAAYIKYTLDGVIVTDKILSGEIVIDEYGTVVMQAADGYPEGSMIAADGTVTTPEGTVILPDGTVIMPDGTITAPDGTVTAADGTVTTPEGTVILPDGTVIMPDGTVVAPNGTTGSSGTEESSESTGAVESSGTEESTENAGTIENTETEESNAEQEQTTSASIVRNEISRVADPEIAEIAEQTEEQTTEPQPDKKAYASVFLGWAFEEHRFDVAAQWNVQEAISVNALVEAAGVTEQDGAVITLYAVWDDCPWIQATDLYYTLEQAQSGYITEAEILSHASASDREDGSPIAPGVHEDGTSFTIPDYLPTDFTQFQHEGSCTENLTVVDSVGNTYSKQITVYIVDTAAVAVKPEGTTRFINEYYYNQSYEDGGLADNSLWKTDSEYVATLQGIFSSLRNDTPQATYYFTHEDILEMKQFVEAYGAENSQSEDALRLFYNRFMLLY